MRCYLRIVRFGYGGNLLGFKDTAGPPQRRLKDGCRLFSQQAREFIFGRKPLAGRNWDTGGTGDPGHLLNIFRGYGFFIPQRIIFLQPFCKANGTGSCHLSVRPEKQITSFPDGFAHCLYVLFRKFKRLHRELPWIKSGIGTHRIKFHSCKSLFDVFYRSFRRQVGIAVYILFIRFFWIKIGIRP